MNAFRPRSIVLGTCVALLFISDPASSADRDFDGSAGKYEEFARLSSELGLSLDRSVTWKGLARDPEFDRLANLTKDDVDLCIDYIADPKRTRFERYVAGFSAYKLAPEQYVQFIRRLLGLRQLGIIPTIDLEKIANPPMDAVPDVIYENYQRQDMQELIKSILLIPDLDDWARKWFIFESNHGGYYTRFIGWLHYIAK